MLLLAFAVLFGLLRAQAELQRVQLNITAANGSEFRLNHDNHDTRLYLTTRSEAGLKYTLLVHSRDNTLLKVEIVKFDLKGTVDEHYDISDMRRKLVHQATGDVLMALERVSPDIHFLAKEIRQHGLRRTTQVRTRVPMRVRRLLPSIPTVYERVLYAALGPFFPKLELGLPKHFEPFAKAAQPWKTQHRRARATVSLQLTAADAEHRECSLDLAYGPAGLQLAIQSHLPSISLLYEDAAHYLPAA